MSGILTKAKNIATGWSRWWELIEVSDEVREESKRRLLICDACEFAKQNKFLEFINGDVETVDGKFCTKCKCPCHQKSLTDDLCPIGLWHKQTL